jgi:methylglutaconyl-CoA hydratase
MNLRIQKNPPSGTIVLSSPENRNALSRKMIQELIEAIEDLHREKSVRTLVLTASGATFCSGVDLKEWHEIYKQSDSMEIWREVASELQDLAEAMLRFPKPIITAVDGPVLGAGLTLLLGADIVVGSSRVHLYANAPRLGLVSGLVAPLATFRMGASLASRLLLSNEPVTAEQAHQWGLIQYLVPSDQIWVKASQIAAQQAETSVEAMQMTKRLINEMIGESLWTHLSSGSAAMATICSTEAAGEGLKAFRENRIPKFP